MRNKFRIGILISIQVLIIIVSFLIISQFTIESEYLGNSINTSGSNRFLGELLFQNTYQYLQGLVEYPPYDIVSMIDTNIYLLKKGNMNQESAKIINNEFVLDNTKIMPVPFSINSEVDELELTWEKYKKVVLEQFHNDSKQNLQQNFELLRLKSDFIDAANSLTFSLGNFSVQETGKLHSIQILLLFLNVVSHLFLLYLIIKILTQDEEIQMAKENLVVKNKKLLEHLHESIIKKNSAHTVSSLLLLELQEAEKLTCKHEFSSEDEKAKYFWEIFYKNIQKCIKEFETSKKNYDDKISYYNQLSKRFKNGMNLLHEKNKSKVTNYYSNTTLDDLRDLIDSLEEIGRISPKNNKLLTDVLDNIIGSKLTKKQ